VVGRLAERGGDIGGEAGQAVAAELTMPQVESLKEPLLSHREADEVAELDQFWLGEVAVQLFP